MCLACIYICLSHGAWCLGKPKENTRYPGTGVINSCELTCGCWRSKWGPWQDQQRLLATKPPLHPHLTTKPSLHPLFKKEVAVGGFVCSLSPESMYSLPAVCTCSTDIYMDAQFVTWVLGFKFQSSWLQSALNCWAISLTPLHLTLWTLDFQFLYCNWSVNIFFYPVMKFIPSWICLLSVC